MNSHQTATRIIAGALPAMALFATPAFAQDAATGAPSAAPPIVTTTTPPPVPNAAPAAATPAAPTASAPNQALYQASLDAATRRPTAAVETPQRAQPARPAAARPAPRVAAPAPSAPVAAAPVAAAPAAAPAAEPAAPVVAAPEAAAPASTVATPPAEPAASSSGVPTWAWLLGALAAIGAIALAVVAMRRRSARDEWQEEWAEEPATEAYAEPAPVYVEAAPAVLATEDHTLAEHADVVTADREDIAAMTAAAPVGGRPWIEMSLRPVRAGATDEAALVDVELTLANAGEVAADNVRVASFMLGDAAGAPTDMERLLAEGHHGVEIDAGTIAAGEGSRVDAHLTLPRSEMEGATFNPVVVADVRYTLPNGGEGRTAAAFTVGVHDDTDTPTPLRLGGDIREDVGATLHGEPERV